MYLPISLRIAAALIESYNRVRQNAAESLYPHPFLSSAVPILHFTSLHVSILASNLALTMSLTPYSYGYGYDSGRNDLQLAAPGRSVTTAQMAKFAVNPRKGARLYNRK